MRKIIQTAKREIRRALAPFVVVDSYGTWQACWTLAEAEGWLPSCSNDARILRGSRVVARRVAA